MKNPRLHLVTDELGLIDLIAMIKLHDYVAYDIETTGIHYGCTVVGFSIAMSEAEAFYVVLDKWNKDTSTLEPVLRGHVDVLRLLNILKTKSLIMHNAIFDCSVTEQYFKISLIESLHTDTMILAHVTNENRRIGLKELATEYFGEDATIEQQEMKVSVLANGGQWTVKNKDMYKADAAILGKYGAKDAWLTYMIFFPLVEELYEQGLEKFFYEDESMPLLKGPTYQMNTTGFKLNMDRLNELKRSLQAEALEAKDFVMSEIAAHVKEKYPGTNKTNHFNIGSSQQLAWLLFGKLELEPGTLTDAGKVVAKHLMGKIPYSPIDKRAFVAECLRRTGEIYERRNLLNPKSKDKKVAEPWKYLACDKKVLTKFKDKHKWVAKLLEYQRKTKILNTYVKGVEQRVQYGIIRPSFLQAGTTSGRYSSRNPNFQNLPRDDKRVKACFVARPGKVFVGADYSQLEPRVFAYFSGDKRLLEAFKSGDDFYSVIGMGVFGKTDCTASKEDRPDSFKVKYKGLRDLIKVFCLAIVYGATPHQIAPTIGKSIDDTEQLMNDYLEEFEAVKQLMLNCHKEAKAAGMVKNLFGRPRRMPEAKKIEKLYGNVDHSELPYEIRNILNLATNHKIQSTAASITNRAAIAFYNNIKDLGLEASIISQVHDWIGVECNEEDAETVALILRDAMECTTDLKSVKLEALPKIGKDLSKVS